MAIPGARRTGIFWCRKPLGEETAWCDDGLMAPHGFSENAVVWWKRWIISKLLTCLKSLSIMVSYVRAAMSKDFGFALEPFVRWIVFKLFRQDWRRLAQRTAIRQWFSWWIVDDHLPGCQLPKSLCYILYRCVFLIGLSMMNVSYVSEKCWEINGLIMG